MRMVKGEGGGARCCEGSERATMRRACKRTAAQLVQDDAPLVLYVPCGMARGCGEERLRGKGAGQAAARGAKGRPRAGHAKRTAAQDRHAAEEVLPVLGLYVPCAMERGCGGEG